MAVTPPASDSCELVDDGRLLEEVYQSSDGYDEHEFSDTFSRALPFRTLPKDHLRLFCLLGRDEKQQLHCRLDTYHYTEAPTYDALSYCWGELMDTIIIICNNKALPIRKNLYAALTRFEKGVALPLRPLWIDAICLNQNNDDEKARQIPRMGNIYRGAERTLIWLGEEAENSSIAMKFLGDLYRHNQNGEAAKVAELVAPLKIKSSAVREILKAIILPVSIGKRAIARKILQTLMEDSNAVTEFLDVVEVQFREGNLIRAYFAIADLIRSKNERDLVSSLLALTSRSWFDRVWVLQELLLSTSPVIVCGTFSIEWAALISLLKTFDELDVMENLDQAGHIDNKNIAEFRHGKITIAEAIRKTREKNRLPTPFSIIYTLIEPKQCQEPVDRIWAVVALLSDDVQKLVGDSHVVDYTEMGKQQYWKSYLCFMQLLGLQDPWDFWKTILACQGLTKHPHLPSWCPDFNGKRHHDRLTRILRAGFTTPDGAVSSEISLVAASALLAIKGFKIDIVRGVTTKTASGPPDRMAQLEENWLEDAFRLASEAMLADAACDVAEMICQTMFCEMPGEARSNHDVDNCKVIISAYETWSQLPSASSASVLRDMIRHKISFTFTAKHKFFSTIHGRVGLGPYDMETSDLVCIVPGTKVALILRAVERETLLSSNIHSKEDLDGHTEFFHLIGDAYLHGCMNGEAFTAASRGPDREFVIA